MGAPNQREKRVMTPLRTCKTIGLALALAMCAAWPAAALEKSAKHSFRVVTVASGLTFPWGMAFLPDGRFLVTERPGRLRVVTAEGKVSAPLKGLPNIRAVGQGGLLDVALHPDFAQNRLVYLSYAAGDRRGVGTEVARGRLADGRLEDVEILFRQVPKVSGGRHFGSRLVFARDGTLFISLGDRGNHMHAAQDTKNHIGTVIRLNDDGTVPKDNPFVGKDGALPEIFSYGHRNVQGMVLNTETGEVWTHELGPRGGDEVNILKAGANYGWPVITHGIDYDGSIISERTHAPGMEQPLVYWDPSIAPSGMAFYRGDKFPRWRGNLFVGVLKFQHLRRLELDGGKVVHQETLLKSLGERIRDVRSGPDGYLYVLTDSPEGRLLRLEPAGTAR